MNEEQVTYFDTAEASAEKNAKTFSYTSYDDSTASTGAFGKLDEIKNKVAEITTNVGDLTQGYKDLEGMYNEFTDFNELMDANIYRFETVINNIELKYNELKTAIEDRVNDQVKADQELMQDMETNTNQMANGEEGDPTGGAGSSAPTGGGGSGSGGGGGSTAPTGTDTTTPTGGESPIPTGGTTPSTGGDTSVPTGGTTGNTGTVTEEAAYAADDSARSAIIEEAKETNRKELVDDIEGNMNALTGDKFPETKIQPVEPEKELVTKLDAQIADEVIQGKWGTGDARKAALEAAGYDPNKVQDIVNQKIKGTYKEEISASADVIVGSDTTGPSAAVMPVEVPPQTTTGDVAPTASGSSPLSPGETPAPEPATSPTFMTNPGDGKSIDIPSNVAQTGIIKNYTNYDYFVGRWTKGSNQDALSKAWTAAGKTSDRGIATYNDRYLVAVSEKFGTVGDNINVTLDNGQVIPCTIADVKGADAKSEWGHKFGGAVDVIEWESVGGQDVINTDGWAGSNVVNITRV